MHWREIADMYGHVHEPVRSADIHMYMSAHLAECVSCNILDTELECGVHEVYTDTNWCALL